MKESPCVHTFLGESSNGTVRSRPERRDGASQTAASDSDDFLHPVAITRRPNRTAQQLKRNDRAQAPTMSEIS
jgi:hypothetical protein